MKKQTILLILTLLLLFPERAMVKAQLPVTDVASIASNTTGFIGQLMQTIELGTTALNQLHIIKQSYDDMKMLKDAYHTINRYLYNIRAIADATSNLIELSRFSANVYSNAVRSGNFSVHELNRMLTMFNRSITTATQSINMITEVLKADAWRFSDYERRKAIEEEVERIEAEMAEMREVSIIVNEHIRQDKIANYLVKNNAMSPTEAYTYYDNDVKLLPGMELRAIMLEISKYEQPDDATTELESENKVKGLYGTYFQPLYYALLSIVALIGIIKVYIKVNLQSEDLVKTIAVWFGSFLTIYMLGYIMQIFLEASK